MFFTPGLARASFCVHRLSVLFYIKVMAAVSRDRNQP
jgi:hypothetical protein